ncbi:MAG: GNAT family N-acetyltransferase [Verrucomicrobia bacterium]|nr:GNAT family N-acetyltransferase [Verrucomicrobiota bacterium]MCG2680238.1 GNAT family N-acetyltransferase [Kiritimatiellia bacterium]MBU4247669.1 GNAT family N-acetyltransferase [Verrucomicrobiota bacterium]MBU4289797.1 GNAT family N-acetyltransferase [Verrucomicrobiota bacterium]MBU4428060.1 GNAT family N-acetyltransferase [Verrucomicrobiota bacterium]
MNIRPMESKDRETVLKLIHETGMFTEEEELVAAELIDTYLTQPHQEDYDIDVVESDAGTAEGYVCYGPAPMTEGTVDLYWIAVHPGRHKQGYGKALVTHVETITRRNKGRMIIIETSSKEKYTPTRQFYLRMGYQEISRLRDYYRPGDDQVIYCKYFQPEGV